jgi:hypothetical protein
MQLNVKKGSTDRSVYLYIIDATDGTPEQGVNYATSGLALWYRRVGAAAQAITPVELAALTTAHSDGGIIHIDDGLYRVDVPDAAFATGVSEVVVGGACTEMIVMPCVVQLVDYDAEDGVRLGLTALPNAAADAAGGLPISDAGALDLDASLARVDSPFAKNVGKTIRFPMHASTSPYALATGLTVTAVRSIDGAAFAAGTLSAVAEVGSGLYEVEFANADMNGDCIALLATATGARPTLLAVYPV